MFPLLQVSTEAPKFKTIARDATMSVVHPPSASPAISWVNQRDRLRDRLGDLWGLRVGERLLLHCESEESFPAASLRFYINDEIVSRTAFLLLTITAVFQARDKTVHTVTVPTDKGKHQKRDP